MPRRILVTGGAGFIGSHVAEACLGRGDHVTVLDSLVTGSLDNVPAGAEFIQADIRDDEASRLVREGGFDIINNHAAQVDVRASVRDPVYDAHVNLLGLLNLLQAAVSARVPRFIHASSGGTIYGEPAHLPTPESAPTRPESPYGVTKLAGEMQLFCAHRFHGMQYVALRYANVYGPRQDPHGEAGVVAIFAARVRDGAPLTIFGDGTQTRDYTYVADVVAANLLASDLDLPPARTLEDRAFNVGTGVETSVTALASLVMEAAARKVSLQAVPARPGEVRRSALDSARLRALGWTPAWSIAAGIERTYTHIAAT